MENLMFSLGATIPIFLTMVVGYLLKLFGQLDDHFVKVLNAFNYKVSLPVLLFMDLYQSDFSKVWDTRYVLFCFFATLTCILVIWGFTYMICKDKTIIGEFVQASYRGSAAVLGLAFIQNIYGHATVAPLMIVGTVPLYNLMAVIILSFTDPTRYQANGHSHKKREALKKSLIGIISNPMIISIALGMIASMIRLPIPAILTKTAGNFSCLASPLALIGLGAGFEGKKALAKIKPTLLASIIRLMIQPAIFLPFAAYMGFRDEKMVALLIMLGAPTTASCYIMAKNMNHEGVLTSSVVVATTFLSSLTMTFWLFIMRCYGII